MQVPRRGTAVWNRLLDKLFFLSEPPVLHSANGGANFYRGLVVRIK